MLSWPLQLLWKSLTLQQSPIAKNKTSSLDRVVVEFYTTYWDLIGVEIFK
jgi:hypothetical protein